MGSHLLRKLVNEGEDIRALKRHSSRNDLVRDIEDKIEWVENDILDIVGLEEAFSNIKQVYHCAAIVSFDPAKKDQMMRTNVDGTANIVNLCLEKSVDKLVHVSSISALGRQKDNSKIDEEAAWNENTLNTTYAVSKFLSEREIFRGIAEGLNAVIVNPSMVIGEGNWKTDTSLFIKKVWKGMAFYPLGTTGWVDVEDVVNIMVKLMHSEIQNERFILSSNNWSYKDAFRYISSELNKPNPFIPVNLLVRESAWRMAAFWSLLTRKKPVVTKETMRISSKRFYYDSGKINKAIGYEFKSLEKAFRDACEKFKSSPEAR